MNQNNKSNTNSISSTRRNSPIPMRENTSTSVNMTTAHSVDNQGLPKDIQRIVAQRIRAFEIAAAQMDAETKRHTTPPVTPVSSEDHGK
jgi:hypothetical protein